MQVAMKVSKKTLFSNFCLNFPHTLGVPVQCCSGAASQTGLQANEHGPLATETTNNNNQY